MWRYSRYIHLGLVWVYYLTTDITCTELIVSSSVMDPDPHGSTSVLDPDIDQNLQINQVFILSKSPLRLPRYVFDLFLLLVYF